MIRQLINLPHRDVVNTSIKPSRVINTIENLLPEPYPFCFSFQVEITQFDLDQTFANPSGAFTAQGAPFDANWQWFFGDGTYVESQITTGHVYRRPGTYTMTCCNDKGLDRISSINLPYTAISYPDNLDQMTKLTGLEQRGLSFGGIQQKQVNFPPPALALGNPTGLTGFTSIQIDKGLMTQAIPTYWEQFDNILTLNFNSNNIGGTIPDEIWNIGYKVNPNSSIGFIGNNLTGNISPAVLNFNGAVIGLSLNNLSGTLPVEIGQIPQLRVLRLNGNNFTGQIPDFTTSIALEQLYISENGAMTAPPTLVNAGNINFTWLTAQNITLSTPDVDSILSDVNSAGTSNGLLNIGGTNSPPTGGAANADIVALQARGWTVIHS